ncbi:unnamed protein product [Choristocarpus tenellus]
MAVRLALGETHLVRENKEYFEKEGIDLSALESLKTNKTNGKGLERSGTVILVKNLPYTTEASDLAKLFGAFGDVGRILLPPSKAVALVEFLVPSDARKAFKRLAYKRFQHVPLYLEWAPVKAFSGTYKQAQTAATLATPEGGVDAVHTADTKVDQDEMEAGKVTEEPCTLYIKNLSFDTTEAGLKLCFQRAGIEIRAVSIPHKKGKGGKEALLSMGFGFVECREAAVADRAIKALQGVVLDGHALQLKHSSKRLTKLSTGAGGGGADGDKKSSKLIVRNVAFQATARELRELFSSFGQLRRLRMPKKFDGGHRGFAFVDFLTAQEALNAYNSLSRTHLYGRHLVLEWAEDNEDLDTLREKAARDFNSTGGPPGKRHKAASDQFDEEDGL